MNTRCTEGDRLFRALSVPYLDALDRQSDPERWANYEQALDAYREHQESCQICSCRSSVPIPVTVIEGAPV